MKAPRSLSLPFVDLGEIAKPRRSSDPTDAKYRWRVGERPPELGLHSVAKHNIYERYLGRYIETLTQNHRQTALNMTIVDGFCGGGLYQLNGRDTDGSPLRMLAVVDTAQEALTTARERGFQIRCDFVFIDQSRDHLAYLEELLKQRGYADRIGNDIRLVQSTFEAAAEDTIARIKKKGSAHRSLFFVDQYGWSAVKLATIRKIMSELSNPEVILTFMVDALINLMHENSSVRALAAIDLKRADVQEMIKNRGEPGWKALIQNTLYRHIKSNTGAEFYSPFYIHPPESHRDYWLLHLSKHHKARDEMGNVYWREQNTMKHFGGPAFDALGFDPNVDVSQADFNYVFDDNAKRRSERALLEQIPRLLRQLTADGKPITRRDLFVDRANDTPVVAGMLDSQLALLRDSGDIIIRGVRKDANGRAVATDRRGAKSFAWTDEIKPTSQPALFLMPRAKGPNRS